MKYCFRCGKETKTKSNLNSHLKNKKECNIIYLDISREKIINNYNKYYDKYIECIKGEKPLEKIYRCYYCDKTYIKKNSYNVHKKKYCKMKENINKREIFNDFLHTKYNLLKLEYEEKLKTNTELIEKELQNKIKTQLENKIKHLEDKIIPYTEVNNNICNNIINNNINNNINNINNIFIINNFGEEKIIMNAKDCEKIMSYEFDMIIKLIEYIHIIPLENRNAFIPSVKEKYAMILKNQKWNLIDKKEFINNLIINKNIMLEKMLDQYGPQFINVNANRSRSVINYCKNDEEECKRIKMNANLLLFNNKDMIRDTYGLKYNKKIKI